MGAVSSRPQPSWLVAKECRVSINFGGLTAQEITNSDRVLRPNANQAGH
jgi:hypothetical protein